MISAKYSNVATNLGQRVYFLLSLIIYRIEKVLFSGRFFEIEFSLDLHVLRSPESENHVFSGWSVCVSVCVCEHHNSRTKSSRMFKFGVPNVYHRGMLPETFHPDQSIRRGCLGDSSKNYLKNLLWYRDDFSDFGKFYWVYVFID